MPTVIRRLADILREYDQHIPSIRLLLYTGEPLHKGQKVLLSRAFPSAQIGPLQYGSVNGGLIGLAAVEPGGIGQDPTLYTVNTSSTIMELITDTGDSITTEGSKGNIVITNLTRRPMPIISYPMGDAAVWIDCSSRKFRFCRREAAGVRIGSASYDISSLKEIVSSSLKDEEVSGFQVLLRGEQGMDEMVFRIACQPRDPEQSSRDVQEAMSRVHEEWAKEVAGGFFNPLVIEWVSVDELQYNVRNGKLQDIVDLRVA